MPTWQVGKPLHTPGIIADRPLYPIGALSLALVGYTDIPTDGSGQILISDIGEGNTDSLICVTDDSGTNSSSDWYYDPTSPTTEEAVRIQSFDDRGWGRNRGTTSDGFRLTRLRRDISETDSVEGVFTCDIFIDTGDPISVGIYYASESHYKWNMLTT